MRIYRIKTHFYAKDLNEEAILGFALAESDEGIYSYINKKYMREEWPELVNMTSEEIIKANGDYGSEFMGEFYDQKYGWVCLSEVSPDDIASLKRLYILAE